LPPLFEVQAVILADRIGGVLQEFDDALQAGVVDVARVERLRAVARLKGKLGDRYPCRAGKFMKRNVLHRGLLHLLVTGAVVGSARALGRWAERHAVESPGAFRKVRDETVRGDEVDAPPEVRAMIDEVDGFLEARVRRTRDADRVDRRGRHVLLGLFGAYHSDPLLLDDHVLLRFKEIAGVRFLRDLPRSQVERQVGERYRSDARFIRLLADHLASMTDAYALDEHAKLMKMGAIPIPAAERLRSERRTP
jgi:dGTPase